MATMSALQRLEANRGKMTAPIKRYPSRIKAIDALFGGGIPAMTLVVAGDPGAGKSTLVLQVLQSMHIEGHITAYLAYERKDQVDEVMRRMGMHEGAWARHMPALMDHQEVEPTSAAICAWVRELDRENKTGKPLGIGIDSFKCVNSSMGVKGQKVAIAELTALAQELKLTGPGVFFVLIAHIASESRGKGKPNKKLQGAAELEELCDCAIMFLDRTPATENAGAPKQICLLINKNRMGQTGEVPGFVLQKRGFLFPAVK